jgi:hypothetical protein
MHHIFNMTFEGKLYLAPIPDTPQRVLDIGTGTGMFYSFCNHQHVRLIKCISGIWAIDFAE